MKKTSIGRTIAGCVIGLALALLTPFLLPFAAIVSLITVVLLMLFVYFGPVGAGFAALACAASAWSVLGVVGLSAMLLVCVLPAVLGGFLLTRKTRYLTRLRGALIAQAAGTALFLLTAYIGAGENLADAVTKAIGEQVRAMPAGFADYYLAMLGLVELPASGLDLIKGVLDAAQREELLTSALEAQNLMLKVNLVPMLVSSCLYTGILACHMPSGALARRGADVEHLSLNKWRIGQDLTILSALLYLTSLYFMLFSTSDAAAPAYQTFRAIPIIVFSMQGLAAVDRMFLKAGHSRTRRNWILVGLFALSLLGMSVLALVGFASAMWGSQGIITFRRKKRQDKENQNDDNEGEF